jgi:hypothetical protein
LAGGNSCWKFYSIIFNISNNSNNNVWKFLILFSYMVNIWITYNEHTNVDHLYFNCGVWTLVSKVGNQTICQQHNLFSLIQSEVNCISNIFHFKSNKNVKFRIQCFIDNFFEWKNWKHSFFPQRCMHLYFLLINENSFV